MEVNKIKKDDFISDYKDLSVDEIKEKYSLNNRSYYKIVDDLGLKRKRSSSKHTKIELV